MLNAVEASQLGMTSRGAAEFDFTVTVNASFRACRCIQVLGPLVVVKVISRMNFQALRVSFLV